jgi:hypothetical protein
VEIEAYNIKAMDGLDVLFIYHVLFLTVVTETTAVMCGGLVILDMQLSQTDQDDVCYS